MVVSSKGQLDTYTYIHSFVFFVLNVIACAHLSDNGSALTDTVHCFGRLIVLVVSVVSTVSIVFPFLFVPFVSLFLSLFPLPSMVTLLR
jgi:hypothetical protein